MTVLEDDGEREGVDEYDDDNVEAARCCITPINESVVAAAAGVLLVDISTVLKRRKGSMIPFPFLNIAARCFNSDAFAGVSTKYSRKRTFSFVKCIVATTYEGNTILGEISHHTC